MTNEDFILQHLEEDVRRVALQKTPEGVDIVWCLQQIEGYQLAKKKLPGWVKSGVWFPPRLSMEQCSSELTAQYKRSVLERCLEEMGMKVENSSFTDLTGGFGIDFSYMAQGFRHATYVERMPNLCDIARHNFPLLGLEHAEIVNGSAEDVLACTDVASPLFSAVLSSAVPSSTDYNAAPPFRGGGGEVFFLDPARRDDVGRKVFALEDCTPNLIELQDKLLQKADLVMVKLSPMLDITQALRSVKCVSEVHVVSVQGECKEVLLVMRPNSETGVVYHCVNLGTEDDVLICNEEERHVPPILRSTSGESEDDYGLEGRLLFEPNASILKAGVQDVLCHRYYMRKLNPISNLYIAPEVHFIHNLGIEDLLSPKRHELPGRTFIIEAVGDFSKAGIKRVLADLKQANITIRNFPGTVADLRKRFKLKEGGNVYIFVTTLADGSHAILRCKKA